MTQEASDISQAAADAAIQEAVNRDYGTSKEDIQAYSAAAAAVVAGAVCGAVSGGTLALACAWVADTCVGWVAGKIYDWFSDDEAEKAARRRAEHRAAFAVEQYAAGLNGIVGDQFLASLDDLRELYRNLHPNGPDWTAPGRIQADYRPAILLMYDNGLARYGDASPVYDAQGRDTGDTTIGIKGVIDYLMMDVEPRVKLSERRPLLDSYAEALCDCIDRSYRNSVLALGSGSIISEAQRISPEFPAVIRRPDVRAIVQPQIRPTVRSIGPTSVTPEQVRPRVRSLGGLRKATPSLSPVPQFTRIPTGDPDDIEPMPAAMVAHAYAQRSIAYVPPEAQSWGKAGAVAGGSVGATLAAGLLVTLL